MAHQSSSSNESDNQIIIPPQPLKLKKPHQPSKGNKQMGQATHKDKDGSQYLEGLVPSDINSRRLEGLVSGCRPGNTTGGSPKKYNNTLGQSPSSASSSKVHNKVEIALDNNNATEGTSGGEGEDSGRERLKRHRVEVAGRVWIPDIWGQEELLKDWIDCTAFDAPLVPSRIVMARTALVEEGRTSSGLRIENRC